MIIKPSTSIPPKFKNQESSITAKKKKVKKNVQDERKFID